MASAAHRAEVAAPLAAEWLAFAARVASHLFEHARLPQRLVPAGGGGGGGVFAGAAAARDRGAWGGRSAAAATDALLRAHLLEHSPIVRGKAMPFPDQTPESRPIFSVRQRRARVGTLMSLGVVEPEAGASVGEARAAAEGAYRLGRALVDAFDACYAYHELWPSLSVRVGPPGCGWDAWPAARTLRVPSDFTLEELVGFVQAQFPTLLAEARVGLADRVAAAERAARARRPPPGAPPPRSYSSARARAADGGAAAAARG